MSAPRVTGAAATVTRNRNGSVTVSAIVPGPEGFRYSFDRTFYGYSRRDASRMFRGDVNAQLRSRGWVA